MKLLLTVDKIISNSRNTFRRKPMSPKTPAKKRRKNIPGVLASPPKQLLLKPVKASWIEFFQGLGKMAGGLAANRLDTSISGFIDTVFSFTITTTPEELAHKLIYKSLATALIDLVDETRTRFVINENRNPSILSESILERFNELETTFDRKLIKHPERFEGLKKIQSAFQHWLEWNGLKPVEALAIINRLPSYFICSLREEWCRDLTGYKILVDYLDLPFENAAERDWAWQLYAARLQRDTEESVLDEPFSLRQIYIPLAAYYLSESRKSRLDLSSKSTSRGDGSIVKNVVDLRIELDAWRIKYKSSDPIRVLSGGPGCGKSSFVRLLAADWASQGEKVLYIPLHVIKPKRDLIEQVGECVSSFLGYNPLDPRDGDVKLILIFDGLDELTNEGKAGAENARLFVNELRRVLGLSEFQKHQVRAILCGREPVVQEIDLEGRRDAEVLNLLPYFLPPEKGLMDWKDPHKLLTKDRRNDWWSNYAKLIGRDWLALPEELAREELDEITPQPLLNYLVALSFVRGEVDFSSTDLNRNEIYFDLMRRVHERGWEQKRPYAAIANLTFEDFLRVLEEVALATWHGDSRSTTVRTIEEYCKRAEITDLLEKIQQGDDLGVMNLLSAFFFRRHDRDQQGNRTFVFTHKSFGEYLTARRITSQVKATEESRNLRRDRRFIGWDEISSLTEWIYVCGPSRITAELLQFIRDEIFLHDNERVLSWQAEFSELFRYQLRHGMPLEKITRPTFKENAIWNRNSSEALLVITNACALKTKKLSSITINERSLGTWIRTVHGQRTGPENPPTLLCLSYSDLSIQSFFGQDFYGADFTGSDFSGTFLSWTWLDFSNFQDAILKDASFGGARLNETNLSNADCSNVDFKGIDLRSINFDGIILKNANLRDALSVSSELTDVWKSQNPSL